MTWTIENIYIQNQCVAKNKNKTFEDYTCQLISNHWMLKMLLVLFNHLAFIKYMTWLNCV
jgi:hypothetical protein